ncbi:MAG: spondin domain-containing protein [Bauldia sp.]
MRARLFATVATAAFAAAAVPALAQDAMKAQAAMPTMNAKTIMITVENLTTGQPFSPSFFSTRAAATAPMWELGKTAADQLVAVAEGGNIGGFSGNAAGRIGKDLGDAALAIHALPGQTRSTVIHVDAAHPLVDGAWMLGNTNDGFSGFAGFDAYAVNGSRVLEVRGYDAGSEKNSEKKGFLGALGGGNERDPENGVITFHPGIRGDADAPKSWQWDVTKPVARVTFTVLPNVAG